MGGDIARATRISIFVPSTPDVVILLVDDKVHVFKVSLVLVRCRNASKAGADADQPQLAFRVEGLVKQFN